MGGALALELAKRGRARSVVAISPGGGWAEDDSREVERIIRLSSATRRPRGRRSATRETLLSRPGFRRLGMRDVMARGHLVPAEEAVLLVRSSIRCSVVEDVFATMRDGSARVVDLDQVTCPTLVAWGEKDRHAADGPPRRPVPRRRSRACEFRVLRGLGHTPMWDDATRSPT